MKIIKDSRQEVSTFRKRIACHICKSIYEADANDINHHSDWRDGDYFSVTCPVCKSFDTFTDLPKEVKHFIAVVSKLPR
jgi:RNA polymerase subunit RPABC4/transcription elongation factor Spt4